MSQPLLVQDQDDAFAEAVREGLNLPQKVIPARFFYDQAGSELFEAITELPEYYPTRAEIEILNARAGTIADHVGEGRSVIEFGSGSSLKTPLLLRAIAPASYVPVDISAEFLQSSASALSRQFPDLPVLPVAADFTRPFRIPASLAGQPRLGFFPGSTLGNLAPMGAIDLLRSFATTLGKQSWLLIGLDLAKDRETLEAAYDDAQGVTAAFNLNLLHRINRELGGTVRIEDFRHRAIWNEALGRIEMHLVAVRDTHFEAGGRGFRFAAGEHIHTENSYKWTRAEARLMARASGWMPVTDWTDSAGRFALHLWSCEPDSPQP
ncbi:L-histidine N(alpha)-methyltransferase [Polymorphobacter sp.]|uniref:L-histidine N(alpha)-methyltransferase n=1 Tax=Polymorphobacter sp. TaxID=1909290 RepID=UPI003F6EB030